jgi:hypothetical protein
MTDVEDPELAAMSAVSTALSPLDESQVRRVLGWALDRFGVAAAVATGRATGGDASADRSPDRGDGENQADGNGHVDSGQQFAEFAELYDAVSPKSNAERALTAAYWVQEVEAKGNFQALACNTLLKHLGHGVGNITEALDTLKNQKPALVLQLKKSGTSVQARKTYKVTNEGVKRIRQSMRSE